MDLLLTDPIGYKSSSQRARVATETWVTRNLYCPACESKKLNASRAGFIVSDFKCPLCDEEYQLKSKRGALGRRILDAAYNAALRAAETNSFPHLLLMEYESIPGPIRNLQVVPGPFITPTSLEARRPLNPSARRAGWVGCNIVVADLPLAARISIINGSLSRPIPLVRSEWRRWNFLKTTDVSTRSWFNEILKRVERLGKNEFSLADVYAFEEELAQLFPSNRFIRPKIRQQLQVLRDRGFLEFRERGHYRYIRLK